VNRGTSRTISTGTSLMTSTLRMRSDVVYTGIWKRPQRQGNLLHFFVLHFFLLHFFPCVCRRKKNKFLAFVVGNDDKGKEKISQKNEVRRVEGKKSEHVVHLFSQMKNSMIHSHTHTYIHTCVCIYIYINIYIYKYIYTLYIYTMYLYQNGS